MITKSSSGGTGNQIKNCNFTLFKAFHHRLNLFMKLPSVALCEVSRWFSVKRNYTEVHGNDTEIHGGQIQ